MSDTPAPPPRVSTGVRRLDRILDGGLLAGGAYAVFGPPGAGKTLLANQLAFHRVAEGDRVAYVTLLSEGHGRLLAHLADLTFFDGTQVGDRLKYLSGYQALEQDGAAGLLKLLRTVLRQEEPALLVVDGFHALESFAQGSLGVRRFVHELQSFTGLLGCTTLLLHISETPDFAASSAVDGLLELGHRLVGPRAVRELTVHKLRGSSYLLGRHAVEISEQGLEVHPRLEVRYGEPPGHDVATRTRMGFGIPRLDGMLGGGLPSGSTTSLFGAPGTGKTLLGLQYLVEGARRGERGLYFGFYETPARLPDKAAGVGIDLGPHLRSGRIQVVWQAPLEHPLDALAERILDTLSTEAEEQGGRLRLVIDDLDGFRNAAVYPDRMGAFVAALAHRLSLLDVTSLLIDQTPLYEPGITLPTGGMAAAVENIVFLRYVELRSQLYRLLSILKMRDSGFDSAFREFAITPQGLVVAESFDSAEAVLTGSPRLRPTPLADRDEAKAPEAGSGGPS